LLVGLSLGKAVAYALGKPFHAVHHLEGHLYSPFLQAPGEGAAEPVPERFTGLVLSGGHTNLFAVDRGGVTTLGETRDDAVGEVFDKVGKRLGLPYPQGPKVDALAELGDPEARPLPVPTCGDSLDFSYSGLKSRTLVEIEKLERRGVDTDLSTVDLSTVDLATVGPATGEKGNGGAAAPEVLDLLAGFRRAAVDEVLDRCGRLHEDRPLDVLAVSGGAAANRLLRRELRIWADRRGIDLRLVPLVYSGDNAAMIAFAALQRQRRGLADDPRNAEAASRIPLTSPTPSNLRSDRP
jgi:N6-L-threonylcarbamoyladenine synthase